MISIAWKRGLQSNWHQGTSKDDSRIFHSPNMQTVLSYYHQFKRIIIQLVFFFIKFVKKTVPAWMSGNMSLTKKLLASHLSEWWFFINQSQYLLMIKDKVQNFWTGIGINPMVYHIKISNFVCILLAMLVLIYRVFIILCDLKIYNIINAYWCLPLFGTLIKTKKREWVDIGGG